MAEVLRSQKAWIYLAADSFAFRDTHIHGNLTSEPRKQTTTALHTSEHAWT